MPIHMSAHAPTIDDAVRSYVPTCHWCDAEVDATYRFGTYCAEARQMFYSPPLCSFGCHDEMYHDDLYTVTLG